MDGGGSGDALRVVTGYGQRRYVRAFRQQGVHEQEKRQETLRFLPFLVRVPPLQAELFAQLALIELIFRSSAAAAFQRARGDFLPRLRPRCLCLEPRFCCEVLCYDPTLSKAHRLVIILCTGSTFFLRQYD